MKKFIYALMVVMGLSTAASFADDKVTMDVDSFTTTAFEPIRVNNLPEEVKESLALNYPSCVVNSADEKVITKEMVIYKVVLLDQENVETFVFLSEEGDVLL